MKSPEVEKTLKQDFKLAQALGLNGTPSYVIGDSVIVGAIGLKGLEDQDQYRALRQGLLLSGTAPRMPIAAIRNQQDYRRALDEIERLMTARRNTRDGARLAALVTLLEDWERRHYPFSSALPH